MSELISSFGYDDDGEPILIIQKKNTHRSTVIHLDGKEVQAWKVRLEDAWQFSEDHYPGPAQLLHGFDARNQPIMETRIVTFEHFMFLKTKEICEVLSLGEATTRRMADIAHVIMQGIDDLVSMKPQPTEDQVIGEVFFQARNKKFGEQNISTDVSVSNPLLMRL